MAGVNNLKLRFERGPIIEETSPTTRPVSTVDNKNSKRNSKLSSPAGGGGGSPSTISKKQLKQIGKTISTSPSRSTGSPGEYRKSKPPLPTPHTTPKAKSFDGATTTTTDSSHHLSTQGINALGDFIKSSSSSNTSPCSSGATTPLTTSGQFESAPVTPSKGTTTPLTTSGQFESAPVTPSKGTTTPLTTSGQFESAPVTPSKGTTTPLTTSGQFESAPVTPSKGTTTPLTTSGQFESSPVTPSNEDGEVLLRDRVNSAEDRGTKGLSAPLPNIKPSPKSPRVSSSPKSLRKTSPKNSPGVKPKPLGPKPKPLGPKPTLPPKPKFGGTISPSSNKSNSSSPEIPHIVTPPTPTLTTPTCPLTTPLTNNLTEDISKEKQDISNYTNNDTTIESNIETSKEDLLNNIVEEKETVINKIEEPQTDNVFVNEKEDRGGQEVMIIVEGEEEEEKCLLPEIIIQSSAMSTSLHAKEIGGCKRNTVDSGYQDDEATPLPNNEATVPVEDTEKWDTLKRTKAREKRKQIALELLETERTYVTRLKIIAIDFKQAIQSINNKSTKAIIPETTINIIFLNIGEIYNLNRQLLDDIETRMNNWTEKEQIGDVISSIAPFLKLYSMYTARFEDAMKKLTETMAKEKKMDTTVKEFERNLGTGLGVAHYMLEPVQRIPRYKLLLEAYFKKLPEDSPERPSMTKALSIIGEAADRTNNRIKELENSNEILAIQRTITDYEGTLLLAHRRFIKKGLLQKLSRKAQTPRMFFLFSDVLLHTEPTGPSTYKFKNELPLCVIKMELPKVSIVPHSFEVLSTNRSFILSAKSEEEMIEWMTALRGAIRDDKEKMKSLKRGESHLLTLDRSGFGGSAPILVPDQSVSMCQLCSREFTFTFRRHHCRACGKVVCGNCSPHKAFLSYMNKEERICAVCNHQRKQSAGDDIDGDVEQPLSRARIPSVLILDHEKEAIIGGYVLEQDGKKWNRCWYVVGKDLALYKYKAHEDIKAIETVPLPGYHVKPDSTLKMITLLHPSKKKKLNLSFKIENTPDFETWVDVIEKASQLVVSEVPTSPENRSSVGLYGNRRRSQSLHNLIDPKPFEISPEASMTPPLPTRSERVLSSSINMST